MHFHLKQITSLFLLSVVLTSCGGRDSNPNAGFETTSSSIIIGELDWEEIGSLKAGSLQAKNAKAVAHVDLPRMGSRCTGFLISENVLMTNQHCIPSAFYAQGVTASFEVVEGVAQGSEKRFDCSKFIGNNKELDFALLECEGNPGAEYGMVKLADSVPSEGEPLYVVQQNCDYYSDRNCYYTKKVSFGSLEKVEGNSFTHNADTLGGSSGSPIFSEDSNKVIAIHHAGLGNNGQGRGLENYGVSMAKIVSHIKLNFPSVDVGGDNGGPKPSNDTPAGAKDMGLNKVYSGSISTSTDQDYYQFTVTERTPVKIELKISGRADLDLYVTTADEKVLARSAGTSSTESIRGTATPGTYYVLVKGYKGAKGSYKLSVSE